MIRKHPVAFALLCSLLLASCSQDGAYTKVGKLAFDDPALKACVLAEAEKHGWQEAGHVTRLHCVNPTGPKINRLAGIEHLQNITDLYLAHNSVSNLDPLVALKRLDRLVLDDNLVSRPGPRMIEGLEALAALLHPELFQ